MREVPKALTTKYTLKGVYGQGNDLGYGKNVRDVTMDNLQPSPKPSKGGCSFFDGMDAVQRLDGGGPNSLSIGHKV
jgi:hypothetical protein